MPYDPAPLDALQSLTVQLEGAADDPETVLQLSRPRGGLVRVDEFPVLGTHRAYDAPPSEVLARIERVARARRRVGVELYAVRQWLGV